MSDKDERKARIAEIDADFGAANGWGSWMVSAANERERLVNALRAEGDQTVEHRWLARTGSGGKVD